MKKAKPLVSIVVITYNHSKYIRQAMESFLAQKVDFSIEILIHDDASTDGTAEILKDYQQKYPQKMVLLLEKENQYTKTGAQFLQKMYTQAKGKYIAVCEGDDYWTDPSKLSLQVEYMESHPESTLCFHSVFIREMKNDLEIQRSIFPDPIVKKFTLERLLSENFIQTNSVMYRNLHMYSEVCPPGITPQDWYTHIFHAKQGKIGFIPRVMSEYRKHNGGSWWRDEAMKRAFWEKNAEPHIRMYDSVLRLFGDDKRAKWVITESMYGVLHMISIEAAEKATCKNTALENVVRAFPNHIAGYMTYQGTRKEPLTTKHIKNIEEANAGHVQYIRQLEFQIQHQSAELQKMHKRPIARMDQALRQIRRKIAGR